MNFGNAGHLTLTYTFTIESAFGKVNQYTYEFPITWGGGLNNASRTIDCLKRIKLYWDFHFFDVATAFLHVERSDKYYYSQLLPNLDRISVYENHTTYYWDLEPISAEGGESTIIIEIINLSTKNRHELRYSIVWLSLGIGIPLVISSAIEILKNGDNLKSVVFWSRSICYIAGGFLIGILTYRSLEWMVLTGSFLG